MAAAGGWKRGSFLICLTLPLVGVAQVVQTTVSPTVDNPCAPVAPQTACTPSAGAISGTWTFSLSGTSFTDPKWATTTVSGYSDETYTIVAVHAGDCVASGLNTMWLSGSCHGRVAALGCDNQPITINRKSFQAWCSGGEEEWSRCSHLPDCNACVAVDCAFGAWTAWVARGACTGICIRSRTVATENNDCGQACTGVLSESKKCAPHYAKDNTMCIGPAADCEFGPWQMWSNCSSNQLDQRYRARVIRSYPLGGQGCRGPTEETQACVASLNATDCLLSAWNVWGACSRSCDGGHQTRDRRIFRQASAGGDLCGGSLRQTQSCKEEMCTMDQDCSLGIWGQWSTCLPNASATGTLQRYRSRQVVKPVQGHGDACRGPTRETQPCGMVTINTCSISVWNDWNACSNTCSGGQRYRSRHVSNPHNASGCPEVGLVFVEACNTAPCGTYEAGDCRLSEWSVWSSCSSQCGVGDMFRARDIASLAQEGKKPCTGVLKEVRPCEGKNRSCGKIDCVWDAWQDWSSCTCTCGGGEKRRNRAISGSPTHGGKMCEVKDKEQIARCNSEPCNENCINGRWSKWSEWNECSASCDYGARFRLRQVAQMPNSCGLPNLGLDREVERCKGIACHETLDCRFTDWNDWSYCSPDCFGTRHRFREISNYAVGSGRACEGAVEHVAPCNPGPNETTPSHCKVINDQSDCELSLWSEWTACTTSCGGGQRHRSRHITVLPSSGGQACGETLSMTTACASDACPAPRCRDCRWSAWTQWGSCSDCGGQKVRRRSIAELPNFCGKRCNPRNGEETTNCVGECAWQHFCSWSEWTPYSYCPLKGCGPQTQKRHRSLTMYRHPPAHNAGTYVTKGPRSIECFGMEADHKPCETLRPCIEKDPRPCIFSPWAEWDPPTCAGLCYRQRGIQQNSNHMTPCDGALAETKVCPKLCDQPVDCKLNDWKPWTMCISSHQQRYRSRRVIQYPMFGGDTCLGMHMINETSGCETIVVKQDCVLTPWSLWTPCEKPCGTGGWQKRRRHIQDPSAGGGTPCTGDMEEMRGCNEFHCPGEEGCDLSNWGEWSQCRPYTVQKYRSRTPNPTEVCTAHLEEIAPCEPMDCQISAWSDWDQCAVTCGGSSHQRQRHVVHDAVRGGKPCSPMLSELQACGEGNCDPCATQVLACATSQWSMWTTCSTSCGNGFQSRDRSVVRPRSANGPGCNLAVSHNRTCHNSHACTSPDCAWSEWSLWTTCSRSCGSGTKQRKRVISVQPGPGGAPCNPIHTEETNPCSLAKCQDCVPVDGEWSPWSEWEFCTATCRGGLSWRTRRSVKEMSACGRPAEGLDREYKGCNEDVPCGGDADCKLGNWEQWSDCSATCDGVASRSRRIVSMGRGRGAKCVGPVEETISCRPGPQDLARPMECQGSATADCVFSEWSQGFCTVTCGGGSSLHSRHIKVPSAGGGKPCGGPITKTAPCAEMDCSGPTAAPCTWRDWNQWGSCDLTSGQRKRFRHINLAPQDGQRCAAADSEETQGCTQSGGGPYCGFASWASWSACSMQCNLGVRHRRRNLTEMSVPPNPALIDAHLPAGYSPSTTAAPKDTCPNTGKCMENGAFDADCCAKPSDAACAEGFTYRKGDSCYGTEYFHTCCSPTAGTTTQVPNGQDDFRVGRYYVKSPVAVTLHMKTSSQMVSKLKANQHFNVIEVKTDTARIRGKVQEPAGWVSLKNLQTGHVWAYRAQVNDQRKYTEQPSLQSLEQLRARDMTISFFCGLCSLLALVMVARRFSTHDLASPASPRWDSRDSAGATDERSMLLRQ